MGGVAQQAGEVGVAGLHRAPHEGVQEQGHSRRSERNEHQRMGELAVVFQQQQRVRGRIDEDVEIRRHARQAAEEGDGAEFLGFQCGLRRDGADRALTDGVHAGTNPWRLAWKTLSNICFYYIF